MKCDLCGRDDLSAQELEVHKKYYHNHHVKPSSQQAQAVASGACPDCGSTLFWQEGCVKCMSCGFNKCE